MVQSIGQLEKMIDPSTQRPASYSYRFAQIKKGTINPAGRCNVDKSH